MELPKYQRDWHLHNDGELLMDGLRSVPNLIETELDRPRLDGDVIVMRYGRSGSHVGIRFGRQVFHAPTGLRVLASPMREYAARVQAIFRPMEGLS
jgi:hypothetical protein